MKKAILAAFLLLFAFSAFSQGIAISGQYDFNVKSMEPGIDVFYTFPLGNDLSLRPSVGIYGDFTIKEGKEYSVYMEEYESTWHFNETVHSHVTDIPVSLLLRYTIPLAKDRSSQVGFYAGPSVCFGMMASKKYTYKRGPFADDATPNSLTVPVDREIDLYKQDPPLKRIDIHAVAGLFFMGGFMEYFMEYQYGFIDRSLLTIHGKNSHFIRAGIRLDIQMIKDYQNREF